MGGPVDGVRRLVAVDWGKPRIRWATAVKRLGNVPGAAGPLRCPVCGVVLAPLKQKLVCPSCHRIIEGCCE